ncbi:MAG: nucleotide sugar dehydrogenase [Candidatus Marinimicrobia bacterium]|nr:nucleotide sugar dehydrogenase [Candidatus Neomarinimicrobiota bacterium]MCF7850498.1 nucleotide sugar dehydrogenase [Candidatus Neomarinimicrobiota bacterium]MCF7903989.1 nucleotide sugar dehydrogenase [Candidatus Neomarinimicrobiota bacterium]
MQDLLKRIEEKDFTVGVVGLGYVGLPLAVEFGKEGIRTIGIDVDQKRVDLLNSGTNYIQDVADAELKQLVDDGLFSATTDFSSLKHIDAVCIAVPTPLSKTKDPDITYILAVNEELKKYVHKNLVVILESTTYPGTTRELILPALEATGLKVGTDVFLLFSPERVDPGNPVYQTKNTPKVIGGVTENCLKLGMAVYGHVMDEMVPVSSPEAAELTKLLENTFRSINIGLANEMAIMCSKLGVNVWEVIDAAATKPFGFMKFTPGPGLGGHCIPIDPHYLSWKMRTLNYRARFIELASEVNSGMPEYVVELVAEGLNRYARSINGSRVLMLGMAYKPDIDDVRESPALDVYALLEAKGAKVVFHDPYVDKIRFDSRLEDSIDLKLEDLGEYDCVVITTNHSEYDFDAIVENAKLVVDTRNATANIKSDKVIRLGAS